MLNGREQFLLLFLALAGVFPSACASAPKRDTVVDRVAGDKEIEREIMVRFQSDVGFSNLWAKCSGGVVTLTGRVATGDVAADAIREVRRVRGVREVVNQMQVRTAGP